LPAAVEAMTAALAHDVDWRGQTGLFVPRIDITGRRVVETEGMPPPPPARGFVLRFVSPLALSGADPRDRPASLFTGLGQRLESLARWHDATLGAIAGRPHLAERARALTFDFGECECVSWTRGSRRQDRAIPMRGLIGSLEIGGPGAADPAAGAMLALGATCHIGADAAFGCGRYQLAVIPLSRAST
jgi:CRISPR-associated endoribonuclease Cas6